MPENRPDSAIGLCLHCRHATVVKSTHNTFYYLCERSKTDPQFSKYPRLPVLSCFGFEQRAFEDFDQKPHS
jgi:hypothetical protein